MSGGGPTVTLTFAGDSQKLNKAFEGVGNSAKRMSDDVSSSSGRMRDNISSGFGTVGEKSDDAEGKFQGFADVITGFSDVATGFKDGDVVTMATGFADLAGGFGQLLPVIGTAITTFGKLSWAILSSPITWIIAGIALIVGAFILLWNKCEWFRNFWKGLWDGIKAVFSTVWDWMKGAFHWFSELPGKFADWFGRVKDAAIGKLRDLVGWLGGLPGRVLSAIGSFAGLLWDAGMDLLRGLWNGIKAAGSWLWGKIKGFFKSLIPGWARDFLGINSPSRVFADIGKYIPEGLAVGIEHNMAPVKRATQGMSDASVTGAVMGAQSSRGSAAATAGVTITFAGGSDSAFAQAFMKLVRTGQIQLVTS